MSRPYFLKTERIGFSTWQKDDLNLAILLWSDKDVTHYIHSNGIFTKEEIIQRFELERNNEKKLGYCYYPIFDLKTEEFIGCCGLRNYKSTILEIGFHLRKKYWFQGLAIEAASIMIDYAFSTLHATAIFAGHHPDNKASQKVLLKLGFQYIHDEYYAPTKLYHPSYLLKNQEVPDK